MPHAGRHGATLKIQLIAQELIGTITDGGTRTELLTNLPEQVGTAALTKAYQGRWTIGAEFGAIDDETQWRTRYTGVLRAAVSSVSGSQIDPQRPY